MALVKYMPIFTMVRHYEHRTYTVLGLLVNNVPHPMSITEFVDNVFVFFYFLFYHLYFLRYPVT